MAEVALPDYCIARLAFGQYDASGHLWEAELALDARSSEASPPLTGGGEPRQCEA